MSQLLACLIAVGTGPDVGQFFARSRHHRPHCYLSVCVFLERVPPVFVVGVDIVAAPDAYGGAGKAYETVLRTVASRELTGVSSTLIIEVNVASFCDALEVAISELPSSCHQARSRQMRLLLPSDALSRAPPRNAPSDLSSGLPSGRYRSRIRTGMAP